MKKFTLISVAILAVALSCSKNASYRASVPVDENGVEAAEPITIGTNIRANVTTKAPGQGALDAWNGAQQLRIFGIPKLEEIIPDQVHIINNISADSPNDGERKGSIEVNRTGSEKFFYAENVNYDFYGYYVDTAADPANDFDYKETSEVVVGSNPEKKKLVSAQGSIPVTIDGTQDILVAKANPDADAKVKIDAGDFSADNLGRVYSSYASRKGIIPNLMFEHQLARFNFKIKAGKTVVAAGTKINVTKLTVASKAKGKLNVIPEPGLVPDENAEVVPLSVHYKNAEGKLEPIAEGIDEVLTNPLSYNHSTTPGDETYDEQAPYNEDSYFGVPLLVMPGEAKYPVGLVLKQEGYTGDINVANLEIDFTKLVFNPVDDPATPDVDESQTPKDTVAKAGHSYDVTITIHGLRQVEITVELAEWVPSGGFSLDPDED